MAEKTTYRLHDSLGYYMSLTSRMQERRLDDWLRPLGLTRITWCILLAVENEGLSRPSEIADFVGIDRTATSRALRQMEEAGLISRASARDDRRMTDVRLSDLGRDLMAQATPLAEENNRIAAARLSSEERDELVRLLAKSIEGAELGLNKL
ncbi:MAG: MarR family transcriptional regulator [Rhodovulum sp.]|jgi:DNA-binding MarR family transcriptional regulator|nr:MarR family transcriptional regulator [Rhodovulum sp.]MEC8630548.1 MarR family transcriptional regulator [Pseudomonadota bacterium]MEC8796680.1 MarR family transcriptional regulator [Pseudomonadota bacterium]